MVELTKKELFNAKNAGVKIENGISFNIAKVGSFPDVDKNGNDVNVSCLMTTDGTIYTTISATIYNSLELLKEVIEETGSVTVQVNENTSNAGRSFFQLQIID